MDDAVGGLVVPEGVRVPADRFAGHGERAARVGLDPVDLRRASCGGADLRGAVLGQVFVGDHFDGEFGRLEPLTQIGVRGGVGDQELGVGGGVADRPQTVQFELTHPDVPQDAGEVEYLGDVPRGDGHGRAGGDTEFAGKTEGVQHALVAAGPADVIVGRADALQ
ncbi:hypothetical protein ACIBCB_27640 [Streptomyces uncialis]|uniref:hypothetical protein n=1 Tax=Streptomyces uncialis TaxID=1048205 RepID=UPI0037A3CF91